MEKSLVKELAMKNKYINFLYSLLAAGIVGLALIIFFASTANAQWIELPVSSNYQDCITYNRSQVKAIANIGDSVVLVKRNYSTEHSQYTEHKITIHYTVFRKLINGNDGIPVNDTALINEQVRESMDRLNEKLRENRKR